MTPARCYVICTTPRSGSTFLCRELERREIFGWPGEFFNFYQPMFKWVLELQPSSLDDYIDKLFSNYTSRQAIFGWKAFWFDFGFLNTTADKLGKFQPLEYIYLERRDEIAQAVSYAYAEDSKSWSSEQPAQSELPYDRARIDRALGQLRWNRDGWDDYFRVQKIEPLRLDYDWLVTNPEHAMLKIAERLGLPAVLPPPSSDLPSLMAQREAGKADWLRRYRQDREQSAPPAA